jgi:outer membrane protein TolC
LLLQAQSLHPEIEKFAAKLEQLDVEKRWAAEKLRPKLQFDYNFLRTGSRPWSTETQNFSLDNNYKMGVQFSVPLLLRQERGKLSLTKLKIRQTGWERQQTAREISNGIRTTYNEMLAIRTQVSLQEEQVLNAARMLEGEQFRFSNGEGSVFLMNQRENSMIGAQIKLEELKAKFGKSKALFYWSAGALQTQVAE